MKEVKKHVKDKNYGIWSDIEIGAGQNWRNEIEYHLKNDDIILLLISPDFKDSQFCCDIEMPLALERQKKGEADVIPIFLRPVFWPDAPYLYLQCLPAGGEPVTEWRNLDKAFVDIARNVRPVVSKRLKRLYINDARAYFELKKMEEARESCRLAQTIPYPDVSLNKELGDILQELECIDEALIAFENAIKEAITAGMEDQKSAQLHARKGDILSKQQKFGVALTAYKKALELDASNASFYEKIGAVLFELGRFQEALDAYEEAIKHDLFDSEEIRKKKIDLHEKKADIYATLIMINIREMLKEDERAIKLNPESIILRRHKGNRLAELGLLEEALVVYNEAIKRFHDDPYLRMERGDALHHLKRLPEALVDYEDAISILSNYAVEEKARNEMINHIKSNIMYISDILLKNND